MKQPGIPHSVRKSEEKKRKELRNEVFGGS
jgi:hypothetical protein